jgi:hypothetical protein
MNPGKIYSKVRKQALTEKIISTGEKLSPLRCIIQKNGNRS